VGDINQLVYLKQFMPAVSGPVLEVGSKDYGSTSSFRGVYANVEYIGIDMEEGENVDAIVDLTKGTGHLAHGYFALAICCSVLEHVRKPWIFAANLSQLIRPGGALYMSVPWVWRYHAYPDDYFRFSWRGIIELFPDLDWRHICYSTNIPNEIIELAEEGTDLDDRMATVKDTPNGKRKYLPYLMVNMIGHKG
jgi:hypothetical protein